MGMEPQSKDEGDGEQRHTSVFNHYYNKAFFENIMKVMLFCPPGSRIMHRHARLHTLSKVPVSSENLQGTPGSDFVQDHEPSPIFQRGSEANRI